VSRKHKKAQSKSKNQDLTQVDEALLLDPDWFYWNVIRPGEKEAEERRQRRAARHAKQKAKAAHADVVEELPAELPAKPQDERELIGVMRDIIETTHHANGWRHLGELGQQLRQRYSDLQWVDYECKRLIDFLQNHPEIFRIKWSAPARKGASAVWVRMMDYQKDKKVPR
jgi:hypothetical protein